MKSLRLIALSSVPLALACALPACSSSSDEKPASTPVVVGNPAADWTMFGFDEGSTYWNKAETKISVKSAANLTEAWTFDGGGNVTSTPVIAGGKVYVLSQGLFALDLATGNPVWPTADAATPRAAVGGTASLAFENDVIYVHDAVAVVHAFNAKDGNEIWNYKTTDQAGASGFSSPVLTKDYVLIGGSTLEELGAKAGAFRGFVMALTKDGKLAWQKYTVDTGGDSGVPAHGATLWSTVSVDEDLGLVYAATGNNHGPPATDTSDAFLAIPLKNGGDFLWKQQIFKNDIWMMQVAGASSSPDDDFGANPVVFDFNGQKLVAGGNKGGDFWVVDRTNGNIIKQRHLGPGSSYKGGIFVTASWDGKSILTVCNGATGNGETGGAPAVLFALDPLTLESKWSRQVAGPVYSPLTVANGVGFFGKNQTLQVFNTETGDVIKEFPTEATIDSAPAVSNGFVVFGSGMPWIGTKNGTKFHALRVP